MKHLIIIIILIALSGCSTSRLVLQENVSFDELSIALTFEDGTADMIKNGFSQSLDRVIVSHNSNEKNPFKLRLSSDTTSENVLKVKLLGTKLVSSSEQATGVFVSAIGLALPFMLVSSGSDFYFFFYYFPKDVSVFEMSLSPDISSPKYDVLEFRHVNSGFLRSVPKQIDKHTSKFEYFMNNIISSLERDYKSKQ